MQNLFNNNLIGSAIAIVVSIPTPLMLHKDNPGAVLAGLAGGMAAGSAATILVNKRSAKQRQQFDPVLFAFSLP
jgi:hypothetical protein